MTYDFAILFVCHVINEESKKRFNLLRKTGYDVFWAYDKPSVNTFSFSWDEYDKKYRHFARAKHPNIDYIAIDFLKKNDYSYVWIVEYDAIMLGDWKPFFDYYLDNDSDLLSSHIFRRYKKINGYFNNCSRNLDRMEQYRSFNPVCRISRRLAYKLEDFYLHGHGFFELVMPTLCNHYGYKMEDIGGNGKYSKVKNKWYNEFVGINQGTIAFRNYNRLSYILMRKLYDGKIMHSYKLDYEI